VRPGGTTFYFVNDGIEAALRRAREVDGGKDIRIGGGAHVIRAYLNAGLVDEIDIALAPVFFGSGTPLFDRVDETKNALTIIRATHSPMVTHIQYAVSRRARPDS
jgi:dihydrofolate reductase